MATQQQAAGKGGTKTAKKKVVKVDAQGKAFINATFNNIIISLTNDSGQVISWSSAGKMGFKGSKKNTPYVAQLAAGPGAGRESAIRTLHQSGIEVSEIMDLTPMPHNGCRPPGKRRV